MTERKKFEDLFDSAVRAANFWGRLDLADVDEDRRPMLADFKGIMNEVFEKQRTYLYTADDQHPTLYFDLIDSGEEVNALATTADLSPGVLSIVGVTDEFFYQVADACHNVAFSLDFAEVLTGRLGTMEVKAHLYTLVYLTAFQFLCSHEIGHHFHGHLAAAPGALNGRREVVPSSLAVNNIDGQAEEVDADGYSVQMTLHNLWEPGPHKHAACLLGMTLDDNRLDEAILECFLTSVMCFFHVAQQPFNVTNIYQSTHPFELARLNAMIDDVQCWCKRNIPRLAKWPSEECFSALGGAVRGVLKRSDCWDEQGAYINSRDGEEYIKHLHYAREQLRDRMAPHRWRKAPVY